MDLTYLNFSSKIDDNMNKTIYNLLQKLDKNKTDEEGNSWYSYFNNYYNKYICFQKSFVDIKCSYCKNLFSINLKDLLKTKINNKYSYKKTCCKNNECFKNNKRYSISEQTRLGQTSAKGHIVTENQKIKWRNSVLKSGKLKDYTNSRRGKTIEEIYGKDTACIVKEKIKKCRKLQKEPHLGCKNSDESKKKMSESAYKKFKEYPELINTMNIARKKWRDSLTEEQRLYYIKKTIACVQAKYKYNNHPHWNYHKAWWQFKNDKDQITQSSYEVDYMNILDSNKVNYKSNRIIYIPYISPKDNKLHYYVPDLLIYDANFENIIGIREVKPYEFAYNPNNKTGIYYKITKAKLNALSYYCNKHNYKYNIVTEEEIYGNKDKKNRKNKS
jgi:hypothetical protein